MKVITISLGERLFNLLNKLVEQKYGNNRSDLVRKLLEYALPRFLGLQKTLEKMGDGEIEILEFKEPVPLDKLTLTKLREIFPQMIDYKFINEEVSIL